MHPRPTLALLACLATGCAAPASLAEPQDPVYVSGRRRVDAQPGGNDWHGGLRFLIGGRELDDSWKPVESQSVFGIDADFRPQGSALGIECGVNASYDSATTAVSGRFVETDASLGEIYAGPRLTLDIGRFHPYVGTGLNLLFSDVEQTSGSLVVGDNDQAAGAYAHAGAYVDLGSRFHLGIDVRGGTGFADVSAFGVDLDTSYWQVAAQCGVSF